MKFFDIILTEDSSLLLHTIHSPFRVPSTGGFLLAFSTVKAERGGGRFCKYYGFFTFKIVIF